MLKNTFFLALILLLAISCKDDEEIPAIENENDPVLNADPSQNRLIFTANYEDVYAIDANSGESMLYTNFKKANHIENVMDYHNGILYCVNRNNGLYAFNTLEGTAPWVTALPDFDLSFVKKSNPVYYNNIVYSAGHFGIMIAIDANNGEILWQYDFNSSTNIQSMHGSPALYNEFLVYGTKSGYDENYLYCLHNKTGELIWKVPLQGEGVKGKTVAVKDDVVYMPGENFEARSLQTGDIIWAFPLNNYDGASQPIITGDKVLFQGEVKGRSGDASLYCLNRNSGELVWEADAGSHDAVRAGPKVGGDFVFGAYDLADYNGAFNARPFAVSLNNGEQMWINEDVIMLSQMVYSNGRLFFVGLNSDSDHNRSLLCLNAATGDLLWEKPDAKTPPIVVTTNGVVKP